MKRQVKICGLSNVETLEVAIAAGADMIGLVFFGPSPRNVSIKKATELADIARGRTKIVALTVDADDALLNEITTAVKPDYIQAHGSETPQRVAEIFELTRVPVIKAIKVRQRADVDLATNYEKVADLILFDAKAPDNDENALPGGNGVVFDWSLLQQAHPPARYMLSGGLDAGNVGKAIKMTDAGIIDVSSGVETSPGQKDAIAIKNFIEAFAAGR